MGLYRKTYIQIFFLKLEGELVYRAIILPRDYHSSHMDTNAKTCLHLECMTGFSNNDRPLLLFSFEFSTITLIYAWIILKTELTLIITNYKYILAGVKGMHRPVDASQ